MGFIQEGIFFKLAHDSQGIYGGDEHSGKVAVLELQSSREILDYILAQKETKLRVPLSMLLIYKGIRLMCSCTVPIKGESTLIYGSCNAGRTVMKSNSQLNQEM